MYISLDTAAGLDTGHYFNTVQPVVHKRGHVKICSSLDLCLVLPPGVYFRTAKLELGQFHLQGMVNICKSAKCKSAISWTLELFYQTMDNFYT